LSGVARVPGDKAIGLSTGRCRAVSARATSQPVSWYAATGRLVGGRVPRNAAAPRTFPPVVEAEGQSGAAPTPSAIYDPPQLAIDRKGIPWDSSAPRCFSA